MPNEVAILGCPGCKVDLIRLLANPVEGKPGHFTHSREPIGDYAGSYLTHDGCGRALERKPVNGW